MFSSHRPYLNLRGNEIKILYESSQDDITVLIHISEELSHRRSFAMLKLKKIVDEKISDISSSFKISSHRSNKVGNEIVNMKDKSETKRYLNYKEKEISFLELTKKITKSRKPESLINDDIWNMFTKSLCDSDFKYKKMNDIAKLLDLIWPESNHDDEVLDYTGFKFCEIKNNFGFEQKRVIISAVSIASYSEVKSFKLLKEKYGPETDTICNGKSTMKFIRRCRDKENEKTRTLQNLENKTTLNTKNYYFNFLLKLNSPWNSIEQSMWDEWCSKIDQNQQTLTLEDVAKIGQFNCDDKFRDFSIGELLNFELRHLGSFSDSDERRSVFYAVAFLGLGCDFSGKTDNKEFTSINHQPKLCHDPGLVPPVENTAMNEILNDFGL